MRRSDSSPRSRLLPSVLLLLALPLGACSDSGTEPVDEGGVTQTVTVPAVTDWGHLRLTRDDAIPATPADPSASPDWTVAFLRTSVRINNAEEGPGDVEVACLCQNQGATDAQVMEMTPENQEAAFDAVTSSAAAGAAWQDAWTFTGNPAIQWYRYNLNGNHQIWPTFNVYLVRSGGTIWKVQLVGYYSATGEPRHITVRFARLGDR